jgi:hypothetical protein
VPLLKLAFVAGFEELFWGSGALPKSTLTQKCEVDVLKPRDPAGFCSLFWWWLKLALNNGSEDPPLHERPKEHRLKPMLPLRRLVWI